MISFGSCGRSSERRRRGRLHGGGRARRRPSCLVDGGFQPHAPGGGLQASRRATRKPTPSTEGEHDHVIVIGHPSVSRCGTRRPRGTGGVDKAGCRGVTVVVASGERCNVAEAATAL